MSYHGRDVTAGELATANGLALTTLASRIERLRWPVEKAADTPPDRRFRRGGRRPSGARPCPELRQHPDGRAYCRWREAGRRPSRYFGVYGTVEARAAYAAFAAAWRADGGQAPPAEGVELTVAELITRFCGWADTHYIKDGRPTSEGYIYRAACDQLLERFGAVAAAAFKPRMLRALRELWVGAGLARDTVNRYAARVVRVFGWAAGQELVPAAVPAALREVEPLAAGRSAAHDPEPVEAVPWDTVEKTFPHLHADQARARVLRGMIELQTASGMRPGEVCELTADAIDRTAEPWVYRPGSGGKSRHRGKRRTVYLGPLARAILAPFLTGPPDRRVFGWPFRGAAGANRWTAVSRVEYARHVEAAARRAGVEPWTPNQLRHRRATDVHRRYESDAAAAAALGNSPEVARQVYVDSPGERTARAIAEQMG